jgi:hypothetical protein
MEPVPETLYLLNIGPGQWSEKTILLNHVAAKVVKLIFYIVHIKCRFSVLFVRI